MHLWKASCWQSQQIMTTDSLSLGKLLEQAVAHHLAGRLDDAAALYQQILADTPDHADALHLAGLISYANDDLATAAQQIQRAIAIAPANADFHFNLGNVRHAAGDLDDAITAYVAAIQLNPAEADYHNNLGSVYEEAGDDTQALACYQRAVDLHPHHAEFQQNLAELLMQSGDQSAAITHFEAATRLAPDNALHWIGLGAALQRRGEHERAAQCYTQALALEPENAQALNNLGGVLQASGDSDQAIEFYRAAIEADPDLAEAHRNYAGLLAASGDHAAAIAHYQEALRLKPDYAEVAYILAGLQGDNTPASAPNEYVAALFDQYADEFDAHLTTVLDYRTPQELRTLFDRVAAPAKALRILDLGCGTGLAGVAFHDMAAELAGVDLSSRMIAKAATRNLYQELDVGDIHSALGRRTRYWDLLVAADVFVYIGDCDAILQAASTALRCGGWLLFSVEQGDSADFRLRESGRYTHSADYFQRLASKHGFTVQAQQSAILRQNLGVDIHGWLFALLATGE